MMKYSLAGLVLCMHLLLTTVVVAVCPTACEDRIESYWCENFESYGLGDLMAQDESWSFTGDLDQVDASGAFPFFASDQGLAAIELGGDPNTCGSVKCGGSAIKNFTFVPSAGITLWSEDFQSFTSGTPDGDPIVPQDSSWDLTIQNADQAIANVADNKMKNLTTLVGWSLFGDLPDGEQVLAVRGFTQGGAPPDGIVTATKTLPALNPTQTTLTASATIATFWNGNRWFTSEFLVQDASGNNIVTFFLNMLSQPGASAYLNGTRLDETQYPAAGIPNHTGVPHDYDFVMDFDNDTVDMFVNDIEVETVAMNADYSPSDVAKVAARIGPYTQPTYQGLSYYDNLRISEADPQAPPPGSTVGDLLAATSSRQIALEFDAFVPMRAGTNSFTSLEYRLQDAGGANMFILELFDADVDTSAYVLNGVNIPGDDYWIQGWNHYKMAMDFVSDTVDLFINHESSPSLSGVALGQDFEPTDIGAMAAAAFTNFVANRSISNYVDNIELYDNRPYDCPGGDVTCDCQVDKDDLITVAVNWLEMGVDPNSLVDPNSP
jgi:hypothetical protein